MMGSGEHPRREWGPFEKRAGTPGIEEGDPREGNGTLRKGTGPSGIKNGTPGNRGLDAREGNGTPGKGEGTPGRKNKTPGKGTGASGRGRDPRGTENGTLGRGAGTLRNKERHPREGNKTPGEHRTGTPGKRAGTPPEERTGHPGIKNRTPGKGTRPLGSRERDHPGQSGARPGVKEGGSPRGDTDTPSPGGMPGQGPWRGSVPRPPTWWPPGGPAGWGSWTPRRVPGAPGRGVTSPPSTCPWRGAQPSQSELAGSLAGQRIQSSWPISTHRAQPVSRYRNQQPAPQSSANRQPGTCSSANQHAAGGGPGRGPPVRPGACRDGGGPRCPRCHRRGPSSSRQLPALGSAQGFTAPGVRERPLHPGTPGSERGDVAPAGDRV